jgi:nitroreductase
MKRRSIRAFKADSVPKSDLEEMMRIALRAPSWGNTQPWGFNIVGGKTLKEIVQKTTDMLTQGVPDRPDLEMPSQWDDPRMKRYRELGKSLFEVLGISREDKERRNEYYMDMHRFFGAPNIIFVHIHKGFNQYSLMDIGIILQTIALLATDRGLGTLFLARSVIYPDVLREILKIPEDRSIVLGVAIGYPDADHKLNKYQSSRGELDEFVAWADVE